MKIHTKEYLAQLPILKLFLSKKEDKCRLNLAAEFASTSGTPLLVVLSFISKIEGASEKIQDKIKSVMKFYEVDELVEEGV